MNRKLNLKKALALSIVKGKEISKEEIGKVLWPECTPGSRQVNTSRLFTGKINKLTPEQVNNLCDLLGCDANMLYGIKK